MIAALRLKLGTVDHIIHIGLGVVFLAGGLLGRRLTPLQP